MRDKSSFRGVGVVLGVCLFVAVTACRGQVAAIPADQARAAVGLVTKLYTFNAMAKTDEKGKPLSKKGTWGVRPARADERVAGCEAEGATCDEVVYRAGDPEIVCNWTVLLPAGGGAPTVVSDNEASAAFMLRVFRSDDPNRPGEQKRVAPHEPPIAKITNMSGRVILNAVVDNKGKVVGVEVVQQTNMIFNREAVGTVANWTMKPYMLNGQPRWYQQEIVLDFTPQM